MKSNRQLKKILRQFAKESLAERMNYIEPFIEKKPSFFSSISYRHFLRKTVIFALLTMLAVALSVTAYSAIVRLLNYSVTVNPTNDEYIFDGESPDKNRDGIYDGEMKYYEPTYVPEGYELKSDIYDELIKTRRWTFEDADSIFMTIVESPVIYGFSVDNERSERSVEVINDIEVVIYDWDGERLCILQYGDTLIEVCGFIDNDELEKIISGLKLIE